MIETRMYGMASLLCRFSATNRSFGAALVAAKVAISAFLRSLERARWDFR